MKSSRLFNEHDTLRALASRSEEARRDVELWVSLYTELTKLARLRGLRSSRGGGGTG